MSKSSQNLFPNFVAKLWRDNLLEKTTARPKIRRITRQNQHWQKFARKENLIRFELSFFAPYWRCISKDSPLELRAIRKNET